MKYNEFTNHLSFNDTTAIAYSPKNQGYQFSEGEISEAMFENAPNDGYSIEPINNYPEIKEGFIHNFLPIFRPAEGIEDEGYDEMKKNLEDGNAELGIWEESDGRVTYILIW